MNRVLEFFSSIVRASTISIKETVSQDFLLHWHRQQIATGINDIGGKFATGVNDTGGK